MKDSFPSTPPLLLRCLCVCVRPTNRAEREVVLSNLDTLCSVALGEKVTEDFLLARDTVITICSITDHSRVRGRTLQLPSDLSVSVGLNVKLKFKCAITLCFQIKLTQLALGLMLPL